MSVSSYTFLIANGAAASQEISLGSAVLVGLTFDGWKATTGAYIKSRPTSDGVKSTLYRVSGDYMLQGVVPTASMFVSLPEDEMRGQHWVTLYSGAPGADVNQDATRTVTISVVYINPRRTSVPQNLSVTSVSASGEVHSDTLVTCDGDLEVEGDTTVDALECGDLNITGTLSVASGEPTFENMTIEDTLTVNDTGLLSIGTGFRLLGYTTAAAPPDTTQLPQAGDACIHYDSDGDKYYLAFNIGSDTVVKVEMA